MLKFVEPADTEGPAAVREVIAMRMRKKAAILIAAALSVSAMSGVYAMAGSAISIDMTGCNDEAWANIAMVNDDTVQTGVNIRSAQSENAEVAGYLYRGGAVRVLYKDAEWTEIQSGDINGYVKNDYLVYGPEAKGLAEHYGTYGVKASWNDVNVFSGMSGDSRIVDTAGDGDTFKLVNKDGDWMTVRAGGGSVAYVPSEEVSVVMVLGGAVPVDGTREEAASGAEENFRTLEPVAPAAGSFSAEESVESYEGSSDAASGSDGAGAADDGYTEYYEDSSSDEYEYTDDGYSDSGYSEPAYTEETYSDDGYTETYEEPAPVYEEPAPTYTEPATYTTTVNTSGSYDELAAQASSLYQEYLTAQAAADAAVANGSGEQAIKDTAAAAVAAYGRYVTAQNAADAAQWGYSADTSSSQSGSSQSGTESASSETTYTEETSSSSGTDSSSDTSSSGGNAASASGSELELLAALIYCEAGNQPYEGQVAVGAVVMNRVASGSFPGSISDVIYQGGQFTPAYSGALASALASGAGAGYVGAASDALAGSDPTGGCLYFNNHRGSGLKIGDHWFY